MPPSGSGPTSGKRDQLSSSANAEEQREDLPSTTRGGVARTHPAKRRREDLFLGDTEAFTFDFGGPSAASAPPITTTTASAAATSSSQAEATREGSEGALDKEAVSAVAAVDMHRPLTLEEVQQLATAAYRDGPAKFLTIPKPRRPDPHRHHFPTHSRSQGNSNSNSGSAGGAATLDEAMEMFQEGLRRYDEGLWRADKERQRVEKERERKRRPRQ